MCCLIPGVRRLLAPVPRLALQSKLALSDVITLMRSHGEHTWFDNTGLQRPDVGAGAGVFVLQWVWVGVAAWHAGVTP